MRARLLRTAMAAAAWSALVAPACRDQGAATVRAPAPTREAAGPAGPPAAPPARADAGRGAPSAEATGLDASPRAASSDARPAGETGGGSLEPPTPSDGVLADLSDGRIYVFAGSEEVASFRAVFGRKGVGKEQRGDEKTPEGEYLLHRGRHSQYLRFLPVGFPNAEDARRGVEAGLITEAQRRRIERAVARRRLPPQHTKLGGQVGIHGFGPGLTELAERFRTSPSELDGTRGCIMILDEDLRRLEKLLSPPTPLVIRE